MTTTTLSVPTEALFERYHIGWERRDPELIASLHSEDTVFHLHDGSAPVEGRETVRRHCRDLFAQYDFGFEMKRTLFAADHWVFEYDMVFALTEPGGAPFSARVGMLDVVTVNAAGEVTRKDIYMNGAEAQAAFARAGIQR